MCGAISKIFCVSCCLAFVMCGSAAIAQQPSVRIGSLGIGGVYRPGLWTEATLQVDGGARGIAGRIEVAFPDGDGFPAFFTTDALASIDVGPGESAEFRLPVKVGRSSGDAVVRIVDSQGNVLHSLKTVLAEHATALSPLQSIWLMIGEDIGLTRQVKLINRGFQKNEQIHLIKLESLSEFPADWKSSAGIELVYMSTSGMDVADISRRDSEALIRWVELGGNLVLSLGEETPALMNQEQPLAKLVPGRFVGMEKVYSSIALEAFVGAQEDFLKADDFFSVAKFETEGIVELQENDNPLIFRSSPGFGQVTVATLPFDRDPFLKWTYRDALLERFIDIAVDRDRTSRNDEPGGRVLHIGYSDISGQLRAALDKFSKVGFVNFTLVAFLTILYLLCIGPGDWFLLQKVLRKMELTWITFPLITLLFGLAAIMLFRHMKTDRIQVNQVEIVDVDSRTGLVRGKVWSHIYSPVSETVDLQYLPDRAEDSPIRVENVSVSWNGFPGSSIGGMSANANTGRSSESYVIETRAESGYSSTLIRQFPLQVSSTRAFTTDWLGEFTVPVQSRLSSYGVESSLVGDLSNPFSFPVSDIVVLYGQWAYIHEGDIEPGGSVRVDSEMRERALAGFLTKSRLVDGRDRAPGWDASDLNTTRIVEMMMFYDAAGGDKYTNLSQRFSGATDMSALLTPDTAILMGKTKNVTNRLVIDGVPVKEDYDQQWTFFRVLLPVRLLDP